LFDHAKPGDGKPHIDTDGGPIRCAVRIPVWSAGDERADDAGPNQRRTH